MQERATIRAYCVEAEHTADEHKLLDLKREIRTVGGDILVDQRAGEPATAQRHVGGLQDRQHHSRIFRKAAAFFHAGEACRA